MNTPRDTNSTGGSSNTVLAFIPARQWITSKFYNRTIVEGLAEPWPLRSPDMTPPDFFWGWLKDQIYKKGLAHDIPE